MIVQNTIRAILFVIMFSIGAAALGGAILLDDLTRYYQNKHILKQSRQHTEKLKSLNEDYDALLKLVREDPNSIKRIAPSALGIDPADPNAVYPKATAEALAAAKKALAEEAKAEPNQPPMPQWVQRIRQGDRRLILYTAGSFLILISLVCFTPRKPAPPEKKKYKFHH